MQSAANPAKSLTPDSEHYHGHTFTFFAMLLLLNMSKAEEASVETIERLRWCEEHHPSLTFEECSEEAGW